MGGLKLRYEVNIELPNPEGIQSSSPGVVRAANYPGSTSEGVVSRLPKRIRSQQHDRYKQSLTGSDVPMTHLL